MRFKNVNGAVVAALLVSLRNNVLAVGAITAAGATVQSGAAYVFANDGGAWTERATPAADDGQDFDNFGVSISVSGNAVLVGTNGHTPPGAGVFAAGAAFVYRRDDDQWHEVGELFGSDGISGGDFGASVAVLNNTLLVGADQQQSRRRLRGR